MENTAEMEHNGNKPRKKRGVWERCVVYFRWFVIAMLAIILGHWLYLALVVDFSFDYMWYAFGAVLFVELFLAFSTQRLRQYLRKKFVRFIVGTGKMSVFLIRWGFILVFTVILAGGLYFKAPWKVLVLDAVLLALLTVVPKKKRKYGWLTLAVAVLAVTVWIFLPESDSGDWRPYTFDEEVATLNAKYGVPEEENAAQYYAQIETTNFYEKQTFEDMFDFDREKKGPDLWDPNDETLKRPWKAEEFPEMAAWLETEKEKIAPFFEATKYDKCWLEVPADPNEMNRMFMTCNKLKKTSQIVQRMAYQDLGGNDIQSSVDKSLQLLQCSYHLQQQAVLVDNLVGWATYLTSIDLVRDMVIHYDLDAKSFSALEQQVALFKEDWESVANRFLDYEIIQSKNLLGRLYEINDTGDIRYTRRLDTPTDYATTLLGVYSEKKEMSEFWRKRQNKLGRFLRWMVYSVSLEEQADLTDELHVDYRERLTDEQVEYQGPENWRDLLEYDFSIRTLSKLYTEINMPTLIKIQKIYRRTATEQKGALIIFALRRYYNQHGHWPETLEPIKEQSPEDVFVDSLNGKQIAYMRPENCDTFILYSFGEDGIDDRGLRRYTWQGAEKKEDDYLMWPQNEEELKKMLGIEEPDEPELDGEMMKEMMIF